MTAGESTPCRASGDASVCPLDVAADHAEHGDFQAAIPLLRAATAGPHPAKAWEMLSQCLTAVDDHTAALEAAAAAVAAKADWSVARATLGRCQLNVGDLEGAAEALALACRGTEPCDDEVEGARGDLAHVNSLLQRRVGHAIGLPGLVLASTAGEGPSGLVWHAGKVLAAWLVHAYGTGPVCGAAPRPLDGALRRRKPRGLDPAGLGCGCSGSTVMHTTMPSSPPVSLLRHAALLELGSGTGVVGLAAACLGAHVTLTDLPEATATLRANVAANQEMVMRAGGCVSVQTLVWQEAEASTAAAGVYDMVLGADLVYNEAGLRALKVALTTLFCSWQQEQRPRAFLYAHKARHPDLDADLIHMLDGVGLGHKVLARQPHEKVTIYLCRACAVVDHVPVHASPERDDVVPSAIRL